MPAVLLGLASWRIKEISAPHPRTHGDPLYPLGQGTIKGAHKSTHLFPLSLLGSPLILLLLPCQSKTCWFWLPVVSLLQNGVGFMARAYGTCLRPYVIDTTSCSLIQFLSKYLLNTYYHLPTLMVLVTPRHETGSHMQGLGSAELGGIIRLYSMWRHYGVWVWIMPSLCMAIMVIGSFIFSHRAFGGQLHLFH